MGGYTEFVKMNNHLEFEKLGYILDDAVGECYDNVARVIEVEYPVGPKVAKMVSIEKTILCQFLYKMIVIIFPSLA